MTNLKQTKLKPFDSINFQSIAFDLEDEKIYKIVFSWKWTLTQKDIPAVNPIIIQ